MSIANKPDEQIFASQAKRNEIDNFPDMLRGWGITFEQTEGIPPMEWFNFLFKRIDENLLYHLQRGLPEWSATLDYPKGAYVQHQGKTYRALMQNKNSPPNTADTDKWKRWAIDLDEINEFIRTNQKSSATDSESEDTVATSKAVKKAYDRAVEAEGKGLPVGAVLAFPSAVQNPHGFLRCDGSSFGQETYPALYQALGANTLPDLRRSDVGMTAYFATDNIPEGWIAFDDIEEQVSEQAYPELYRHLVEKYGSLSAVPKAKDRFIRNAGALLAVGEVQQDALQDHFHYIPTEAGGDYQAEKDITIVIRDSDTTNVVPGAFKPAQKGRVQANNTAVADGARAKTYLASTKDTTEKDTRTAEETRPKSLVLKLCIKAQNTLDGVQFWIKAFGNVSNAGELEVSRLAQDIQQVRAEKADISHTHTASEITNLKLLIKEAIARSISNKSVIGGFKVMKYPDGTMIQTYGFNQNDIVGTREKSFMWPEAFIDIPLIFASVTTSVNTSHDCGINILTKSNKSQCFYYEYEHGTLNQGAMRIQFLAIGRWKTSRRSRETVLAPEVLEELESYFREAGLST
ncbi:tail fiber protein [Avibacterium paragallinarum]|uniref:tail fiber protein n=1 Tax=Avibacterium paragallinarum TaxID=728 RepID=UPI00397DFE79